MPFSTFEEITNDTLLNGEQEYTAVWSNVEKGKESNILIQPVLVIGTGKDRYFNAFEAMFKGGDAPIREKPVVITHTKIDGKWESSSWENERKDDFTTQKTGNCLFVKGFMYWADFWYLRTDTFEFGRCKKLTPITTKDYNQDSTMLPLTFDNALLFTDEQEAKEYLKRGLDSEIVNAKKHVGYLLSLKEWAEN